MCRPTPVGSRRHDIRMRVRSGDAPWSCRFTCGAAPRDPRATPSTAGAATIPTATAASCESRPVALGLAVSSVERLANGSRHRETGDGHRVASPRRPVVLDVEESATQWTSARRRGCAPPHSDDVEGQSALGRATNARRAYEIGTAAVSGDSREIHCLAGPLDRRKPGARSSRITFNRSRPPTSLWCRPPPAAFCLCWCYSPTSAAASCTSRLPPIRRPHGLPNNFAKPPMGRIPSVSGPRS